MYKQSKDSLQLELDRMESWLHMIGFAGLAFLAGAIVATVTHSAGEDWFAAIWLWAMTGVCTEGVVVLLFMRWRDIREMRRRQYDRNHGSA